MNVCLKVEGIEKRSFIIVCQMEGITELESHHSATTIVISDLSKNHLWMLKSLCENLLGDIFYTVSSHLPINLLKEKKGGFGGETCQISS